MNILLARPRGFCAGVRRAIDVVDIALDLYGPPIYVKHEIVHNTYVVEKLREKGVLFVESVEDIPEGANAVFSAHGSPPPDYERAKERNINLIDSVCPLVTKVHYEAKRYGSEGYTILLIGHRGHVETVGTIGEVPERTVLIETLEEARDVQISDPTKVVCLTQTTLSVGETKEIIDMVKRRFPNVVFPPSKDICYATTNRQAAVKKLAEQSDCVLVVGSSSSSNSNRLREVASKGGTPAYLIDRAEDVIPEWVQDAGTVGITAGASAPETLVRSVVSRLQSEFGAGDPKEVDVVREHIQFPLPQNIVDEAKRQGKPIVRGKRDLKGDT